MESKDYEVGYGKPPKNRQFGKPEGNPRRSGMWDVSSTPRYKLEQMMKLPEPELRKVAKDEAAPLFERKLATAIAKGQWREIKEMIEQVYGKAKESMELSNPDGNLAPTVRIIDERNKT